MTIEAFWRAKTIITEIEDETEKIADIREAMNHDDIGEWRVAIRRYETHAYKYIDHCGLLPEFLEAVYEKHLEKVENLKKELAEL
ncbi:MAG: hypothetical protein IJI45_16645 [Anaerolineaceae bacterium]|nr:hypothetical protein [Anaerolineaceae bacterium]